MEREIFVKFTISLTEQAPNTKNKYNFLNLLYHKNDFKISAELNFFATAHGKRACDGIGGVIKNDARRSSLQNRDEEKITGPKLLFNWAKKYNSMEISYVTKNKHEKHTKKLKRRYTIAKTLKNTRNFH